MESFSYFIQTSGSPRDQFLDVLSCKLADPGCLTGVLVRLSFSLKLFILELLDLTGGLGGLAVILLVVLYDDVGVDQTGPVKNLVSHFGHMLFRGLELERLPCR